MLEVDERQAPPSRGWAEDVVLPPVIACGGSAGGSRPPSGPPQHQPHASSRQSSAGARQRDAPGPGEESATSLPSIPSTPREQHLQQHAAAIAAAAAAAGPVTDAERSHGGGKLKLFEENLEKFIRGGGGAEQEQGESRGSRGNSRERGASSASSKNTPRGGRRKSTDNPLLAAAYGVSPYLQEIKVKKKLQLAEASVEERSRPEAQHRKKYIKMLKTMEEEAKRAKEESEKKLLQQQQQAAKLRAKMGVENVAPRLFEPLKRRAADGEEEEEGGKKKPAPPAEEDAADDDDPEKLAAKKAKAREAARRNKVILERQQKMLQEISERRRQDEEDEEERRKKEEKLREKLRKAAMEAAERAREEEAEGGGEAPSRRRRADADDEDANAPDSPKRGDVEKAIRNRSKRYQDRFSSEAEEEAWLRKKYGFTETDKLFNIAGSATSYEGVRQALLARGWKEHREEDSMIFDLKWTLKTSDIAFKALNKDQLINHFARNGNLTTKVGLTRNLRNLKWFEDVDMDQFFPRSYDLADPDELCDFVDDFKMVAAENVLKLFLRDGAAMKDCQGRAVGAENYSTCVQLALLVLDAHIRRCNVLDIDDDDCCNLRLSPLEWTLLLGEMCPTLHRDREPLASVSETAPLSGGAGASAGATHWNQVTAAAQLKRQRMVGYSPYGAMQQGKGGVGPGKGQLAEQEYNEAFVEVAKTRKFKKKSDAELRGKAEVMLKELKAMNTQSSLNGYDNVWIVKPAGKSRGRDIMCIRSINRLLDYIGYGVAGKEMQWVVQKYMERPYLINDRKFDFRQWVMVTDWNPLMVWFYDECYLRFSMANFSMENLEDNFTHLCNNSIQKEQENFERVKNESMWDLAAFRAHLVASHPEGDELWTNKILPQMQNISKWALMCAQDMLENRKNSSEVYGYDFMLDEDFNVWLLEVNASPDMSASTPVTERLTSRVMDDMIKVMVDAREFNWGRKKQDKTCDVDTGGWELIYRGEAEVSFPISAFGCKLALTGSEIVIPKVFTGGVPTYDKKGSKRETRADKLREEQKKKEEEKLKEEERKREEKKAQLKAEMKKKKKDEKRREREAARLQRLASEGAPDREALTSTGGEVLEGWGDDDDDQAGVGMDAMSTGFDPARAHSVDSGSAENKEENKEESRRRGKPSNWALKASEKVRENPVMREKMVPRNASQRQVQPMKQVLATNVVSLGDCFGDPGAFPFS